LAGDDAGGLLVQPPLGVLLEGERTPMTLARLCQPLCLSTLLEPAGVLVLDATGREGPDGGFVQVLAHLVGGGRHEVTQLVDRRPELGDVCRVAEACHELVAALGAGEGTL
jgi:hypothetical protein